MGEKKTLEEKYAEPGEELKTGTIVVFGIGFFLFLLCLYFASITPGGGFLIAVGIVVWALCALLVSKNIKGWLHGKRRESLIKSGKLNLGPKKSYNRDHKFDDE